MLSNFTKRLSMRPVTSRDDPNKLAPFVEEALHKLEAKGKDVVGLLTDSIEKLETAVSELVLTSGGMSWEVKQKDPRKLGTVACYNYMLKNLKLIRSLYSLSKILN